MKPVKLCLALVALQAAVISTAEANYFHNKELNTTRNVGSAPSPTPEEIRYARGQIGVAQIGDIVKLVGRTVYGGNSENLGMITDVDTERHLVALQVEDGSHVALSVNELYDDGKRVFAPAMGRAQLAAMPRIPANEFDEG